MIKHCVFLNFKSEISESEQFDVFEGLSNLKNQVEGLNDFEYGNNLDFEQKSADYNSGFIASFENNLGDEFILETTVQYLLLTLSKELLFFYRQWV